MGVSLIIYHTTKMNKFKKELINREVYPIYVASYLTSKGEFGDSTMISRITKNNTTDIINSAVWGKDRVTIETINLIGIENENSLPVIISYNQPSNTYQNESKKLVPKDEWDKALRKLNKLHPNQKEILK